MPSQGWVTLAPLSISGRKSLAVLIGTAKPMPTEPRTGLSIAVLMPTTSPRELISGPPELPGVIGASVWIMFRIGRRPPAPRGRATGGMTPGVVGGARAEGLPG